MYINTQNGKCPLHQQRIDARQGFALVVSLGLMAFVLLLVLSLSLFVQVESHSAEQTSKTLVSRSNAVLGMMVAIGELQEHLGPDARVSARAELEDRDAATVDVEGVQQQYWTGVWRQPEVNAESFPEGLDPQAEPELLTWLVSGNSDELTYTPLSVDSGVAGLTPVSSLPGDQRVTLLPSVEAGTNPGSPARSALEVPVMSTGSGGYAYCVLDEGVQTSINAEAPNFDAADPPLLPLSNGQSAFAEIEVPIDWEKIDDLWPLIPGSAADPENALSQLDYDATTLSRGLLTDTLRGGLQMDLSTALRLSKAEFAQQLVSLLPDSRIYKPYHPVDIGEGPPWDVVRQFGQLETQATSEGYAPTLWWPDGMSAEDIQVGITPLIERFQLHVVVRLSDDLDPDPDAYSFRPRIYYLPALVLWNPYDKPLVAEDGLIFRWRKQGGDEWGYHFAAGYYDASLAWQKIMIGSGDIGDFPSVYQSSGDTIDFKLRGSDRSAKIVIPPGESRVFTMDANAPFSTTETSMVQGFNNYGLYQDALQNIELAEPFTHDLYLDVRSSRLKDFDPSEDDKPSELASNFFLRDAQGQRFLRLWEVRWRAGDYASNGADLTGAKTVSEISGHRFGDDSGGAQPFPVYPGSLPSANTPVYSDGSDTIVAAYELGLKTASPKISNTYPDLLDGETLLHRNNLRTPSSNTQPLYAGAKNSYFYINRMYAGETLVENPSINQKAQDNFRIDIWGADNDATFLGHSDTVAGDQAVSLFHLPRQGEELLSIGGLRHLDLRGTDPSTRDTSYSWFENNFGPAFVVGEAHANSWLSSTSYTDGVSVPDYQWIANRQLWDRFFVSTLPDDPSFDLPLPNGKMGLVEDTLDANVRQRLGDFRTAASELVIEGAFNVNSTSIRAWEALFSQYFGRAVGGDANANESPFIDLPDPASGAYETGGTEGTNAYTGFRRLDRDEISALAEKMVEEVKRRGPFLSLSGFVNRSLRDDPETNVFTDEGSELEGKLPGLAELAEDPRIFGALQAAIEKAGLNLDFEDDYFFDDLDKAPLNNENFYAFRAAGIGAHAEGAPGYLTQGKLLQRLGSILRPRSDTFTIRAYGDCRSPVTGEVESRSYCEAVLQRSPVYVDAVDEPETVPANLVSAVNQAFGRRFHIVSFRWLTPPE